MNKIILGEFDCSTGKTNDIYIKNDLIVRTSKLSDMSFVDKMQKENSYAIGFIQKTIWTDYVYGGKRNFVVFICEKNNDMVGYILLTPGKGGMSYAKIQQIAVRDDARRLDYGTALIECVRKFCHKFGRIGVSLRCRKDLESNNFWKALGFEIYGIWEKGKYNHVGFKASNDIFLWKIDLNETIPKLNLIYKPINDFEEIIDNLY